jgi:hypothetical protein
MTDKTKKIIAGEGIIFLVALGVLFVFVSLALYREDYHVKECDKLIKDHNIKLIKIDYRLWGGSWDSNSFKPSPDPDINIEPMVYVVNKDGKVLLMDKNKCLWPKIPTHFDLASARPIDEISKEEMEVIDKRREKNEKERNRLEKRDKVVDEKLRIAQRVLYLKNYNYIPPLNTTEWLIVFPLIIIIFIGYPFYAIVRISMLITWLIKTKRITQDSVIKAVKIAFSKDVLIRVALVLGIIFLSVSLLKSCGIIEQ